MKLLSRFIESVQSLCSVFRGFTPFILGVSLLVPSLSIDSRAQSSAGARLRVVKQVDKTQARQGDLLNYTMVVTNSGTATASNVVVRDSVSTGLTYQPTSVSAPDGTRFVIGSPISTWTITELAAGQSLVMTIRAVADSAGILYNTATVGQNVAKVCTSVPLRVCVGDEYVFQLNGPPNRSRYQWYRNGAVLTDQTAPALDISQAGSYSLVVDNIDDKCPDFSCCPLIIEEVALPTFKARTVAVNCAQSRTNGQLILSDFDRALTYQYSLGTSFDPAAALSGAAKAIPENGLIASNLPDPATNQAYTVRVYNETGCYTDQTVNLAPSGCCSLTATPVVGACDPVTNAYSSTVVITLANPATSTLTITDGVTSTTVATTTGTAQYSAVFAGLPSNGLSHTVTASLAGCSLSSTTYTAPASCSIAPPTVAIKDPCQCFGVAYAPNEPKRLYDVVDVTAQPGQRWRIAAQTGMLRPDTLSRTSVPVGTTLTETAVGSGRYQLAFTHDDGLGYSLTVTNGVDNLTIANQCQLYPSVTTTLLSASVCQSARPVALTATVDIPATTRFFYTDRATGQPVSLTAFNPAQFAAGEVISIKTEVTPQNPARCSFTLVQSVTINAIPTFVAQITPVSCTGKVAQANGRIQLSQYQPGATYQYSLGSTFNASASLSGAAQAIPGDGLIVNNLSNPETAQDYTVRVYNASGCFIDQTVRLETTTCVCPPPTCIPITVQQIRGVRRR